jgi:4-alpha-glucanotransferase
MSLDALATAAGLQRNWTDANGTPHRVSDEALTAVLSALGLPAKDARTIAESLAILADEAARDPFLSADAGKPFALPARFVGKAVELHLEGGGVARIATNQLTIDHVGYHHLVCGEEVVRLAIAIAPPRCVEVSGRIWAPAVQIPALRCENSSAFGDFGTLAASARAFAGHGADAMAISPVHALFPADASRYSPYAPSSRLFLNVLYGDPTLAGGTIGDEQAPDLIDWQHAIPARLATLRRAFDAAGDVVHPAAAAFATKAGDELERHARFDALHAHFFDTGARGWQDWPAAYHDPAGNAVARFAGEQAREVAFYRFLQWLAHESLDAAQRAAIDGGMSIGLIADLAVGMDGGGSHAWSRPDDLLTGLSIGAPPDPLGPDGQGWGITGFAPRALRRTGFDPFIATLRAALDHAGGIRIDHALGLRRLWVIPDGGSPADGAYLTMPLDDMLRILAIESHKAKAIVIGEDLGTVPEGLRPALDDKAVLGMQVLWFERDADGDYRPPEEWSPTAAAMTGTHDLPTVAGWWEGRDIDWAWKLHRSSAAASEAEDRAARVEERARLWSAIGSVAPEPAPDQPQAVVDAATAFVGRTPCPIAILPLEDIVGLVEQPNLPGTIDEHPNWRRRMPDSTDALLAHPAVAARVATLDTERRR